MCKGDNIMKVKRVRFHGFGHWIDQTFTFHDGINLIEAPNESGKSTLIQGIFALLYGRNKEGDYKKKQKAVWFEQFIPWEKKNVYGGEIDYIVDQEIFRLIRSFHDDDQQLVKWKTGEDITESFMMDQKKERLFLESQMGLSGDLMKRICFISFMEQPKHRNSKDNELAHKLTSLMRQGEELNVYSALQFLNKQIHQIGEKQNASNTPYGRTQKKIKELEHQIHELKQIQNQIERDEQHLKDLLQREVVLDEELRTLQQQKEWYQLWKEWDYLQLQKNTIEEKLDHLMELQDKLAKFQLKEKQIQVPDITSEEDFEAYIKNIQKRDHLEQMFQEHNQQMIDLQTQLDHYKEENYLLIQLDLSQAQRMVELLDQYKEMEANTNRLCSQMFDQKDQYKLAEKDIQELKKLTYSPYSQKIPRFWLMTSLLSGLLSLGLILFHPFTAAILAIMGMGSISISFFIKRRDKQKIEKQQQAILNRWNVESVFELYRKQEEIESTLKESGKKIEQRMEHIRQQVKKWMTTYEGPSVSFDPDQWKSILKSYMQKSKEKKKWVQSRESRIEYLNEEKQRIRTLLYEVSERIKREKSHWGTDRISEMNRFKHQSGMKYHLRSQIEMLQIEIRKIVQKEQSENWSGKLAEVSKKIEELIEKAQGAFCLSKEDVYFDHVKLFRTSKKEGEYLELKRKIANLKGSLKVRYQQLEELSDLEMERKKWLEQLKELDQKREVFQLAFQTLEEARRQVEENIAPQLKPYMSKWISRITQGRYQDCNILPDKGLALSFFEPKTGRSIPVSYLSRGTINQMYFALRLAIIQFYSEQRKGTFLPLFLDDSFAHFDDLRLREMMNILHHFSKKHQIFLCTCQDRERRVLKEERIPFQFVPLSNLVTTIHHE